MAVVLKTELGGPKYNCNSGFLRPLPVVWSAGLARLDIDNNGGPKGKVIPCCTTKETKKYQMYVSK